MANPHSLVARIIIAYKDGFLFTHNGPDVDAILSLIIIYWMLRDTHNVSLEEFTNKVALIPADSKVDFPDFGIDIGEGISLNNIKRSDTPIILDGNNISPICSSLFIAYNLLSRRQFDAIRPLLIQVNDVDTKGISSLNFNNSQDEENAVTMNLWTIMGMLQQDNSLLNTLMIAERIFSSYMNKSISDIDSISINLNNTKIIDINKFRIAIPPVNAGRAVSTRCFKTLRATAVIFSTFNESSSLATLGVSVSKLISTSKNFNLQDIIKYPELQEFAKMYNLYTSAHVIGRTDKAPFLVDKGKLDKYINDFANAMSKFFVESFNGNEKMVEADAES